MTEAEKNMEAWCSWWQGFREHPERYLKPEALAKYTNQGTANTHANPA